MLVQAVGWPDSFRPTILHLITKTGYVTELSFLRTFSGLLNILLNSLIVVPVIVVFCVVVVFLITFYRIPSQCTDKDKLDESRVPRPEHSK